MLFFLWASVACSVCFYKVEQLGNTIIPFWGKKEWCGFLLSCFLGFWFFVFSLFSFFIILLPLSLSAQGGYSAPSFSPWQGSFQGIPRTVPPHRRQSESVPLTHLPHRPPVAASPLHAPFIS